MQIKEEFITKNNTETYNIYFNDNQVFSVKHDLYTSDKNTLFDNFKDCYNVLMLLKKVYELGKNNVNIEFSIK